MLAAQRVERRDVLAAASAAAALLIGGSGCPASVDVLEGAPAQHRAIEAIDLPQTVGARAGRRRSHPRRSRRYPGPTQAWFPRRTVCPVSRLRNPRTRLDDLRSAWPGACRRDSATALSARPTTRARRRFQ